MSVHQQPQSDAAQDATLTGSAGTVRAMPQTPQQFLTPEQKARFRSLAKGVGHTASEIGHAGGAIVDKLGRKWDPKLHPRDSRGRFIETGGTARLWGGGTAKVVRILGNGKIEVQKPDGKRERVKANRLTMISRPDGSKPTDSREKVLGEDARRHADPKRGDGVSADDHGDQDHDGIPDASDLDADGNGVRDDADKRAGHKAPKKAPHAAPKKADPRAQETEALREHYRQGSPGEQLDHMQELFNRNTLAEDQTLEAQGNGLAIRRSGSRTWQVFHANTGASLGADNVTSKEQARQLAARLGEIHDAEGNRFDWKSPGVHERFATFRDRSGEGLEAAVTRAEAEHHLSLGEKGESHRKVTMARGRGLVDQPNPHQDVLNQQDDLTQRLIRQNADALGQPTPNVAPIPQAPEQPATPQAVQDLASVEEQAKRDGDLVLFHGGLPEGTGLDGIDLNRNGAQQNKRGRSFGGFYLADDSERSKAWAEDYAKKRNGNLTGFAISKDARIHETDDVIDRLSAEDRAKLAEKYDLVKGRDSLGRTQYVLLNKDVVRGVGEHNLNGDQPNQPDAPNAPETPAEPFGHMNELMAATKATQGDVHAELGRQHSINGRPDDLEQRQRVADMFSKAREQAPARSPEELDRYLSDLAANVRSVAEGLDDSDPRQREAKTKALEVADRIDAHRARVDATARKARAGKHDDQHAGAGDQQGHTAPDTTTPEGTNGDGSALREDRGGVLADVPAEQGGGDRRPDGLLRSDGAAGAGRGARGGGRDTAAPDEQQQRADRGEAGSDAGRGGAGAEGDRLPDAGAGDGDAQAAQPRAARRGASRAVAGKGKPARKFRPTGQGDLAPKGEKAKLAANMEALRTLRKVQAEDRPATPEEQRILARWAGWGALKGVFDPEDHRFDKEREELRGLLSPEEWELAKTNRLNAHYTDAALVQDVWGTLTSLGFDGGEVLEAGSGSGNFFGFAPEHAHMTGVEQDPITAGISKLLYPDADVWQESFGRTPINPGTFDAVVGNVPFGNFPVRDPKWNPKNRHSIHDHFLIKEMDALKPGGVMAVISSQFTLNGQNDEARRKLYAQGDLIGAVRLPAKAHSEAAGTDVVTDLLLFRKRKPGEKPGDDSWLKAVPATHPDGSPVLGIAKKGEEPKQQLTNGYFAEHPENVLGTMKDGGYNGIAVEPDGEWAGRLKQTLAGIAQQARKDGRGYAPMTDVSKPRRLSGSEREGSMSFAGVGKDAKGRDRLNFEIIEDGRRVELPVPATQQHELRSLLELRDLYQQLLDTETSTSADDDPDLLAARKRLERAYDAHVGQYGPITRYTPNEESGKKVKPPVMSIASQDEASALLYGLEHGYDPATGTVKKADVFTKRQTDVSRQIAEHTSDPREAVDLAFEKDGKLDLATVARMLQMRPAQAREAIRPHVFENPAKPGELLRREEYLSGYTRQKLKEAREAAETDPRFAENVKALEEVVPPDATLADVPLVLGSTYIDPRLITAFARHLMGRGNSVEVVRDKEDGSWKVPTPKDRYGRNAVLENETWGTADRSFYKLLEAVIKQQHHNIVVRKKDHDGNSYIDKKAGEDATAKAEEIADAFVDWVWSDSKHSEPIVKAYTEKFRAITPRSYDGSRTRELPGASKSIHLRQHQNDAIARAVAEPSVLLDHAVGAGKTFELAGVAMELKRLGLARKPVLTVPSPLIEAWVSDFRKLYPNARILAGDSDTLSRSGGAKARKRFAAMAQASDWDVVILTHEAFESIPVERDTEQKYLGRQLEALESQLRKAKAEKAGKRAEAAIQTKIEKAKAKIEEQLARRQDGDGITFEKLGFDYVLVDEAHKFKNLSFNTLIDGVQPPEGSGRARDMHMKLDMLRERAGDSPNARVAAFATGTPISNSLAEMYTMTRFLRPDLLKDAGIEDFDSWAAAFAQVSAKLEVDTAANSLVSKTRLRGFTDALGDALRIWRTFTDTKTHEDLNLPRPALKGGQRQVHVTEMTPEQRRVMGSFIHRVDAIPPGKPEKGQDTHVAIIGDGRRAAVDPRLISARGKEWAGITGDEDFHNPKIAEAADTIAAIHREHADRQFKVKHDSDEIAPEKGAAQLVMLDADSPKKDRFSAYQLLKDELVARGIPADKIRFIQEARNADEKQRMIDDANQGRIAVLMGSTEALGTGTNVQNRLAALHHLDGSWKPSDIEQREGRILRQGNQFPEVEIHAYITKGTHDQKVWDMTSYKQGVLSAIAAGDYDMRAVEFQDDVDPLKDFDTLVGAASVDPLVADHREVEAEVKKLERLANSHRNSIKNAESIVRNNQQLVKHLEQQLGELREARSLVQDTSGDKFKVSLGNSRYSQQEYTSRKEAASFLADAARVAMDRHYQSGEQSHGVIGTIGGFQIALTTKKVPGTGNSVILSLRHPNRDYSDLPMQRVVTTVSELDSNGSGVIARLENVQATGVDRAIKTRVDEIEHKTAETEAAAAQALAPFKREKDLEQAKRRKALLDQVFNETVPESEKAGLRQEYEGIAEEARAKAEKEKAERIAALNAAGEKKPKPVPGGAPTKAERADAEQRMEVDEQQVRDDLARIGADPEKAGSSAERPQDATEQPAAAEETPAVPQEPQEPAQAPEAPAEPDATPEQPAGQDWGGMRPSDFDSSQDPSLLTEDQVRTEQPTNRPDDEHGTPDMFDAADAEQPAEEPQPGAPAEPTPAEAPSAPEAPAAPADGIRQGEVGMKLGAGEQVLTASGRTTTPFPRVDTSTPRKTDATLRRVDAWLHENAKAEIAHRGLIDTLPKDPKEMSQADKDTAEHVLFDPEWYSPDQKPRSILKPLTPREEPRAAEEPTAPEEPAEAAPEAPQAPAEITDEPSWDENSDTNPYDEDADSEDGFGRTDGADGTEGIDGPDAGAAPSLAQWEEQGYQVEKRGKTVYFTADSLDKFIDQPQDLEYERQWREDRDRANAKFEAPEGYSEVAFDDLRPGDLITSANSLGGPRVVLGRERQPDGSVVVRTVLGDESGKVRYPKGQPVHQLHDGERVARKDDTSAGRALWEQYANVKGGEYAKAMQPVGEEEPTTAEVYGLDGDYSTVMRYEDLRPGMRVAGMSYGPKPKWNDTAKPVRGRVRDFTSKHYLDVSPDARPTGRHVEANLEDENGHFLGELFRRGFVAVHKDDAPEGYNLNEHRDDEHHDESIADLPNEPEHVAEEHEREREREDEERHRQDRNRRNGDGAGDGGDAPDAPDGTDLPDGEDDDQADDGEDEGRGLTLEEEERRRRRRRRRNRNGGGGGNGLPGGPGLPGLPNGGDDGAGPRDPHAAAAAGIADERQRFRAGLRHRLLHPLAQFDATAQHEAARIEDPAKRQAFERAAAEARDTAQEFADQLTENYLGQIADAVTPEAAEAAYYGGKNKLGKGTGRGGIQSGDTLHALDDQLAAQVEQLRATAGADAAAALERALGKDDVPAARPKGAQDGPSFEVTRDVAGPARSAAYEALRAKVGPDASDRQRAEDNAELDRLLGEQPAADAPAAPEAPSGDTTPQAPQVPEPAPGLPTSREGWGLPAKPKRRIPESARRRGVPETAEPVAPEKLRVGDTVWLKKADGEHGPVTVESTSFDGRHVRVIGTDENGQRTTGLIPDHAEAYRTAAAPEGAPEAMGQPVQASEAGGPILPGDLRPGDVFEGRMPTGASTDKVKRQLRVTGPAVKRGFMHEVPVEDTRTGERGLSKVPSSRPVMVSERGAAPEAPASAPTVEQQAPAAAVDHPLPESLPKARNALMDALVRAAQGEPNARTAALRFAANALLEGHKFGAPADLGHAAYEKPKAKAGDRWPQVRDELTAAVDQIGQLADELEARGIDTRLSPPRKGERGPALPDFLRDYARGFRDAARADEAAPNAPEPAKEAAPQAPEWTKSPLGITAKAGDWTAHVRPTWGGKHEWEVSLGDKRGHGTADSEDAAKRAIGNQIDAWRNSGLTSTPAPVDARRPDEAPLPTEAPDAPAEAPEPINGQGAEWVRTADLMPGDTARVDGTDMRGRPASAAGYVQGTEPVRITTGRRSRQGVAVTLTENQDGSGWRQVVVTKADGIAARATNGTLANPEAEGAPESLPESQVLTGDLPERLPVDQGGVGIFPGSLVDDQSKTGVVTEAASDLVTVRWDDGKTEQVRGDQLTVTDNGAARPDGWTASGVKAKPGLVVETGKGRGVVESVDGDRATVLTPKGSKVVPVASMRVVGEVQPDGPKAPTAAQPVHATEKPAGELAQGDVFLLDGQPVKVEAVSGDLHHRTVDYSTADGRRGTVEMDAAEVMQLVDGATPSPAAATPAEIEPLRPLPLDPIEGPEVHPRLTTGQRGAINQLGLDMAEGSADPQVAQAAARIREERALSIEQTRALADELRSAAEQTDSASLRRSLTSAADRLDKAGRGASGEPTLFARPVTEDGPADAVTPDQIGAGDEVWVPKGPKHAVQGTVVDAVDDGTGIWLLTLDRDGHREVHPVAADDVVYRAPGRSNAEPAEQPQIPAEDPAELEDRMVAPEVQERMEDTAQGVVENAAEAAVDAESIHEAREAAAQALTDEEVQAEKERVADEFYDAAPEGEDRGDALGWGDLAADDAVEQAREEAVNVINDVEPLPGESEQDTIDRMIDALLDVPAGLDLDAEKHRPTEAPAALNGGSNGGSPTDQARDGLTVDDLLAPPAKPGRPAAERRAEVAKHVEDEVASVEAALFALMDEVGDGSGYTDAELDALIRKRLGAPNSERGRRAAAIVAAALGEEVRPGSTAAAASLLSRIRGRVADAGRKAITDWKARGGSLRRSLLDRMRSVRASMPSWPEYRRLMRMAGPDEDGNGGGAPAPGAPDAPTGLAAQVAQAAAGLPEVGRFGQVKQRGRFLGGISLADLKSGRPLRRTPGERWALDRAADDGPGATALGHLDAVRAAGDTVDQAMTGRMAELLPGLGVDPHAAVRDSKQRMLDAERAERAAFAVGQGVDEARAAARQAREQHEKLRKQYAAALSQAAVETLRQVRPMGADGEARLGIKGDRRSTAALRWAEQFIPTDWLDAAKAETITARISDRGYFVAESGEMGLADAGDTAEMVPGASHYGQVALHELAHFFEGALPDLTDAEWAYYWRRTSSGPVGARKRRGSNRQVSMADRFPGAGFEPHEVTREDSFADPYVGVETDQGKHYELLATSFESLFGGSDYLDDDLRKATMGLLATLALQKREGWAPTP